MSGATSSHSGLTRRSFLKATGAVAGAAAVMGVATPTLQALAADYESGQKESEQERIFRGVCRPNCFAFCHLNVHVRDGKWSKPRVLRTTRNATIAFASEDFRMCIESTIRRACSIQCDAWREPNVVQASGNV